jgi:hypothetical protein
VSHGQRGGSHTVVNLSFLTGAAAFLSSSPSFIFTWVEWTPFHIHCYSENLAARRIVLGTSVSAARKSDQETTAAVLQLKQRKKVS